jgi:biopolymer transport protein ExbD
LPVAPLLGAPAPAASTEFQFRWVAAADDANSPVDVLPDATDPTGQRTFRVLRPVVVSAGDVDSAGFSQYQGDAKELAVFFSPRGGEKFARATAENIGRQLAIVWRGRVLSAPVVRAAITGRRVSLTGRFTDAEAQQLLNVLNQRTAAAPLNYQWRTATTNAVVKVIAIAADGVLIVAGVPCPANELGDRLKKLATNQPIAVEVHTDKQAAMKWVTLVLDACKATGIQNVSVMNPGAVPKPSGRKPD